MQEKVRYTKQYTCIIPARSGLCSLTTTTTGTGCILMPCAKNTHIDMERSTRQMRIYDWLYSNFLVIFQWAPYVPYLLLWAQHHSA